MEADDYGGSEWQYEYAHKENHLWGHNPKPHEVVRIYITYS